jgi:GNAT superfamily N-acetyltransferase
MAMDELVIREARREEHAALGQLMVSVYARLEGFPSPEVQPRYYEMLANVGQLASPPHTTLLVAAAGGKLLGGVVYFSDMAHYGSGGTATRERNASGFRLLAVDPEARARGVGRALAQRCIALAKERGHRQVILHTTAAMKVAWRMYETLGFERSPDLDFLQGELPVFGFRLTLAR